MVFSSAPLYLDPPNWQQQPEGSTENAQLTPPVPPPPHLVGGGGTGSIRPGSLADRARQANLSQPEAALKCPRCDSTNTKFCYFNNYSLLQPRHFCKTCRRYWTRGGELRNVPVGGGYRRNKKSKVSRSKSPANTRSQVGSSSTNVVTSNNCTTDIIGHLLPPPPQLPFFPSLHHLTNYDPGDIGLNFGVIHPPSGDSGAEMEFQIGTSSSGGVGPILTGRFVEQWRPEQVPQFPFLAAGLEPTAGAYQNEPLGYEGGARTQLGSKPLDSGISQMATLKVEENQKLNLSSNFLGISGNDQYYWSGNTWTELSGFTSSTSHLL